MNKQFLLIICIFNFFVANSASFFEPDKKKQASSSSYGIPFLISANLQSIQLNFPEIYGTKTDFAAELPLFGKYFAAEPGYLFNQNLVVIENQLRYFDRIPKILIDSIIKELYGIQVKSAEEQREYAIKLVKEKKVNLFSLIIGNIFGSEVITEKAAKDNFESGIRNISVHSTLASWLPSITNNLLQQIKKDPSIAKREDFGLIQSVKDEIYIPIKMGVFEPNGILNQAQAKEKFWNDPVEFNAFGYQAVNIHKDIGQLRFSPDTAQFKIEKDRQLVNFWFALISPDKNTVNIYFVTLIDNKALSEQIEQIAKKATNLNDLILELNKIKLIKKEDQDALNKTIKTIQILAFGKEIKIDKPIQPEKKEIFSLFSNEKLNSIINKVSNQFPELIDSSIKQNIYQIRTTQSKSSNDSLIQSIKNGIFIANALDAYEKTDAILFTKAIENIKKQTASSDCVVKQIEAKMKNVKDIAQSLIEKIAQTCAFDIVPGLYITLIENITDIHAPRNPSENLLGLFTDLKTIKKRNAYTNLVLLHTTKGWVNVFIWKEANEPTKYVILDPQNINRIQADDDSMQLIKSLQTPNIFLDKVKKFEFPKITSIFGKDGYLEFINQFLKNLSLSSNPQEAFMAKKLIERIRIDAQDDIALLTPLRSFFASYKLYPADKVYLDEKEKIYAKKYFNEALDKFIKDKSI